MSCDPCSPWVELVATTIFGQGVEWKLHAIFHSGSESSTFFSLSGAKVTGDESSIWNESSRERKFQALQGAKVRGNESSSYRTSTDSVVKNNNCNLPYFTAHSKILSTKLMMSFVLCIMLQRMPTRHQDKSVISVVSTDVIELSSNCSITMILQIPVGFMRAIKC